MIAVQTNDRLYLINMEDSEFVDLVMRENIAGRSLDDQLIPLIRARSGISFNSNDMVRFAKSMIPEISNCFSRVGNRFDMRPVSAIEDLNFFVDENGIQYASEEAYKEEHPEKLQSERADIPAEPVPEPLNPVAGGNGIPNPVSAPALAPSIPNPEMKNEGVETVSPELSSFGGNVGRDSEEETFGAVEGEMVHRPSGVIPLPASFENNLPLSPETELPPANPDLQPSEGELPPVDPNLDISGGKDGAPEEQPEEEEKDVIIVSEEQKRAASQLDNMVRNFPNIASLPAKFLEGIRNYVNRQQSTFKDYAEQYVAQMSPLDRKALLTDYPVPNAFGESGDMLDSLLIFPVSTRILSKRDFSTRFSPLDLVNATMLRVCPIGIQGEDFGQVVQGYVQEIKITSQDVKEADAKVNAELKKQGKSKRTLSAKEKYDLYEEALEEIIKYRKGGLSASRETKLVEDIEKYEEDLRRTNKLYIPSIAEWNSYDVSVFDARRRVDQFPTPLITQLQNINGKTLEEVMEQNSQMSTEFTPLDEQKVSVALVDTSIEYFVDSNDYTKVNDTSKRGWSEVNLSEIPFNLQGFIEETQDGKTMIGYCFDRNTDEFITTEEYERRCQEVMNRIAAGSIVHGGAGENPFSDGNQEDLPRTIKIRTVDSVAIILGGSQSSDIEYTEISENFIDPSIKDAIVETDDGFALEGYVYDKSAKNLMSEEEFKIFIEQNLQTQPNPEPVPPVASDSLAASSIPNPIVSPVVEPVPLHLQDRKLRRAIIAKIPTVFSKGVTEKKIKNIPNYQEFVFLSEDDMAPNLQAALTPTADGYTLDGYFYDYDRVGLITAEEYSQALSALKTEEEEAKKEPERVRVAVVDTSFEYLKDCPTYSDFCSKSDVGYEDKLLSDVPTEIRGLLAKEGEYLAGGGYFYNRSINQFVSLNDYTEQLNEVWHKILDIRAKQVPSQPEGFKPIIDPSVTGINMGGIPLGGDTLKVKPQASAPAGERKENETPAATLPNDSLHSGAGSDLVDYVRADGVYVDPDGIEWSTKEEYELYRMLTDDTYLSAEEEKGAQK